MSGPTSKKLKSAEGTIASNDAGDGKAYDAQMQKALEKIEACQHKIDALDGKTCLKILKVMHKHNKRSKPFFERRNHLIQRIPKFWATVFVNHPKISAILEKDEKDCLRYLSKLEVEEFNFNFFDYKISFHFEKNPYFANYLLSKAFYGKFSGDLASSSSTIIWKKEYDLSKKKEESEDKGRKRALKQVTFFSWFSDHDSPSADDIADVIKDDIWKNPLKYYFDPDFEVENAVQGEDDGISIVDVEVDEVLTADEGKEGESGTEQLEDKGEGGKA